MKSIMSAMTILVPVIVYPYVCRVIKPEGVGSVSFAQNIIVYFTMLAQMGIPTYGIRACARVRDDKTELSRTVHELMFINIITCAISYALFAIALAAVPQMREDKTLFIIMALPVLLGTIGADWFYSGIEQYPFMAAVSVTCNLLMVAGVFIFVKKPADYILYGLMYVIGTSGAKLIYFLFLPKYIIIRPLGGYNIKRHLGAVGIFFMMAVATTIYTSMDSVMLGFMKGTVENGYYDAAVKIKMVLVSVITTLGTVILPRASYYIEAGETKKFQAISAKALDAVIAASVPCAVFFGAFAVPSILFLSGPDYGASVAPMRVIMPSIVFIAITGITGIQIMVPLGREKQVLHSEITGAVINIIANALLIPHFGASGAAAGTVLAELSVLIVQFICLKDMLPQMLKAVPWWKTMASSAAAFAASFWIAGAGLSAFPALLLGFILFAIVYAAAMLLLKEPSAIECLNTVRTAMKKN